MASGNCQSSWLLVSRNVSFVHDIKASDCCMYDIFCFEGTNCMCILHIYSFCGLQLSKIFLPLLMFRFKADLAFQRSHSFCIKQLVPRKWILFPPLVVVDGCWYIINYNYPRRTSLLIKLFLLTLAWVSNIQSNSSNRRMIHNINIDISNFLPKLNSLQLFLLAGASL